MTKSFNNHRRQRRELLRIGGLSLFGMGLGELLQSRTLAANAGSSSFGQAKSCILLFMWGGPAHQDTWDLKPEAPTEIRGAFKPISTVTPGLQICEHFPQLAQRTDRLAIVRSMTHGDVNHTSATHFLLTGQAPPVAKEKNLQWPHIGSVLSKLGRGRSVLPPFVSMRPKLENTVPRFVEQSQGQFAGWLGPAFDPLTIDHDPSRVDYEVGAFTLQDGVSLDRLHSRRELLQQLDRNLQTSGASAVAKNSNEERAYALLSSASGAGAAFRLDKESDKTRDRYGRNPHGQSVLQARRLIERGVPLVTVFWPNDGIKNVSVYWDTHSRNFVDLKDRLMPVADQAFSALLDDLKERGLDDETLVVWTGEFGRTPRVGQRNSDAGAGADGRDHWPNCFTSILAGAGVQAGTVYGKSDKHAAYPAENPVAPQDLVATIYHALGVRRDQTLPDMRRRPMLVRPGKTIPELLV